MARAPRHRCGPADRGLGTDNLARAGRYKALALAQRYPPRALVSARSRTRRARRRRHRDMVRQAESQRRGRTRIEFPRPSRRSTAEEILVITAMDEKKPMVRRVKAARKP